MKYNKRLDLARPRSTAAAVIFPYIVAAPQYFAGQIGLGTMTQTADAFGQVQGSLSWFVDSYSQLAAWKAVVDRLTSFGEAMVVAKRADEDSALLIRPQARPELALEDVDLEPARRHAAVAQRQPGRAARRGGGAARPFGQWQDHLFRALAGLWPFGRGRIATPLADSRVLFCRRSPTCPSAH